MDDDTEVMVTRGMLRRWAQTLSVWPQDDPDATMEAANVVELAIRAVLDADEVPAVSDPSLTE